MMLPLLLDSALRSLLLGGVAWAALKAVRLCDSRTETAIWTAVLIAALSMPLLCRHAPGLVVRLPLPEGIPAAAKALELPDMPRGAVSHDDLSSGGGVHPWQAYFRGVYLLGVALCALRLVLGLLLSARLYRRAVPVGAAWARARNIRATAAIRAPVSLAGAILLPADHGEWSAAKRTAVLAHEEAHIARGDFFVQLAAAIHCAVFWFSPFAWWLQTKLAEIAETASDEAAIRRLNDRAAYAEILVEVSRRAQRSPLGVAMAKSSFIEQRVEHILSEAPPPVPGRASSVFGVALVAVVAIAVAGARAAIAPVAAAPAAAAARSLVAANPLAAPQSLAARPLAARQAVAAKAARAVKAAGDPAAATAGARFMETTPVRDHAPYDPRALLDPRYAHLSDRVPAADVSVTYAMERRLHARMDSGGLP